jgi:hypothetical protein
MSTTLEVGRKLVELCQKGQNMQAIDTLYDANVVSIEAMCGDEKFPQRMEGIAAIREKNEWWLKNHDIHEGEARGPFPNGDRFIVLFNYDVTAKDGPMKGQRMQIEEAALYTVTNGKITQEEFFYHMGG